MLSSSIENKSIFRKINPAIKFLFFCLSIITIFLPGAFFNQLIIFSIFIPLFILARLKKKTYFSIFKTYICMLFLFIIINWITIKNPFGYYLDQNNYLFVGGLFNFSFTYINPNYDNIVISQIYGGNIYGEIDDNLIQNFVNTDAVNNWFSKFKEPIQKNLIDLVITNNSILVNKDVEKAKALLYLLNNDFLFNEIDYKHELVKNSPFIFDGISYKTSASIIYNTNWYTISPFAFSKALLVSNKILLIIMASSMLISTTTSIELTNGLEKLLSPLKIFRFPSSECALVLSIGIRFIPSLISESKRILNAQASRGLDYYNGNLIIKLKSLIALVVPLFSISIKKSDDLANAMDARGYVPNSFRTQYRNYKFSKWDFIYLSLIVFVISITIAFSSISLMFSPFGIFEIGA